MSSTPWDGTLLDSLRSSMRFKRAHTPESRRQRILLTSRGRFRPWALVMTGLARSIPPIQNIFVGHSGFFLSSTRKVSPMWPRRPSGTALPLEPSSPMKRFSIHQTAPNQSAVITPWRDDPCANGCSKLPHTPNAYSRTSIFLIGQSR